MFSIQKISDQTTLEQQWVATLRTSTPHISCLAAHNGFLYSGSINQINVFDLRDYIQIDTMNTNDPTSGSVKSIAFTAAKIFTAHQDCKIRVWQITPSKQHRLLSTLPTVKDRLYRLMSPRNYVHVRRHHKRLWIEHWDTVSGLVVNGGLVYSVSWDKSFKIWSASNHKCLSSVKAHDDAVNAIAVCKNGVVYTGSADGLIGVWERDEKRKRHTLVTTLEKHKCPVNALALNDDGSVLFSGSSDRSIMVWKKEGRGGEESGGASQMVFVEALRGHGRAILCLNNVGGLLVSGSSDRTVRIWKRDARNSYRCAMVMEGHESPVKSVAVSVVVSGEQKLLICSAGLDGEIRVWKV